MGFARVDGYLLGESVSKPDALAELLAERISAPEAAPFYRALEAVGTRAADEAFVAVRLLAAGKSPSDAAVRRLRALANVARACAREDRSGLAAVVKRDGAVLTDLPTADALTKDAGDARAILGKAARDAYFGEL